MSLDDEELRRKAEMDRLLSLYHFGRSEAFEEARRADPANSPVPTTPEPAAQSLQSSRFAQSPSKRSPHQRVVLDIMRCAGHPVLIGEIQETAQLRGIDLRRDQIREVLNRLMPKGIIGKRGARYCIEPPGAGDPSADQG